MKRRFYPPTESDIEHNMVDGKVYADVHRERIRAHAKFDPRNDSRERAEFTDEMWLPILVEEVGEVARTLCDDRLGDLDKDLKEALREELVQVAAMTTAWIDSIDLTEE